ncbi:hypothetical protein [Rhizobium binxianense]
MYTFNIQSDDIATLHYNVETGLLLVKYRSGDIRNFTRISPRGVRRLLGPKVEIDETAATSDSEYASRMRKGGLRALYYLIGISPSQFDFPVGPLLW